MVRGTALIGWLARKGFLVGELFTTSGNWLMLEGAVPPESAIPQRPRHQKAESKSMVSTRRRL